jgi:twinkle protein
MTLPEKLLEQGIRPCRYTDGAQKLTCPRCSHTRRDRRDPCLSLTIDGDGAVWNCHHCHWAGCVKEDSAARLRQKRRLASVRPQRAPGEPTAEVFAWLAARGISEVVARRNRIGSARVYIPKLEAEADCIAFPYSRNGELVNIKFRALVQKAFTQVKDAEAVLFGLDDITETDTVVFVEGECDKLACEEAGFLNVVSVPNGAQAHNEVADDSVAFAYLAGCAEYLDRAERIILAVDADENGRALESELARRLGRERCRRVRWPDSEDAPCKDANETLMRHGPQVLRECIEAAEPYPIAGLHSILEYAEETIALYRDGRKRGLSTGWSSIDELMTIRPGELSLVTGIPNHGKSEFIDALAVNLAQRYGWVFAVCSFENPPPEHIAKLAEKYLGLPFWDGPNWRMSERDLQRAMDWVEEHFVMIRADDEAPTIDWILDVGRVAVTRRGARGLVVDPYNEVEHQRPPGMTETEYVSLLLGKLRRFAQLYLVHIWIVAHPKMLPREGGKIPVPTLYDVSGSAHWANKPDLGIVVHRPDPVQEPTRADIYIRKVRFKSVGKIGVASLQHDPATGRYSELRPKPSYVPPPRAYRE